jgi:hypothetical protein
MSQIQSLNEVINKFQTWADAHYLIKEFRFGHIDTFDIEKWNEFPIFQVIPPNVTYATGSKTFSFQIILADIPRDKETKTEYQREVLSDLQQIVEDFIANVMTNRQVFGELISVQNVSIEPFIEEFANVLTGWTISFDMIVPYYWSSCDTPSSI